MITTIETSSPADPVPFAPSDPLRPGTEAELSELVKGTNAPLAIRGGGTRPIGRPLHGTRLDVSGLSGISLYEPGALTIVAGAGTPIADLETALAAENQRLAFEPMDHRALMGTEGAPTVGGVVAANVSGPRRIQAGACRDSLIGVRFVDGTGAIVSNGGRVMKNVTGYDLVKLMAGSHGTLGILTEVAFKVLPDVEATAVLLIEGLSDKAAIAALSRALGSPYEVTGAAHVPVGLDGTPVTMIRLEGFASSVAYRSEKLAALLSDLSAVKIETDPEKTAAGWRWVRNVEAFADKPGDVWRLSVKPTDAPELVEKAGARAVVYDWGGGLVWLLVDPGTDLRARLDPFAGHATLIRASNETREAIPVFQPEPAPLATIAAGLRQRFDPRGILNPGLMG